jgi:predicted PurR-regulated permease PerM
MSTLQTRSLPASMSGPPGDSTAPDSPPSPIKTAREKRLLDIFLEQVHTVAMSLLIMALLIWLLLTFAVMLQQLVVALFLVYLILPVRNWLGRYRLSAIMTYTIILVGVLVLGWLLAFMVRQSFSDFNHKWPEYEKNIGIGIERITEWVPGVDENRLKQVVFGGGVNEPETMRFMRDALLRVFDFGGQLVIVLVYVAFLLAEAGTMNRRLHRSFPDPQATDLLVMLHRINASISKYVSVKTFISILVGASTTLVLWLFGVDYAAMWGIIAFVLNYIPYIGAAIAVLIPALLSILQTGNPALGVIIFVLLNGFHSLLGYWLEPVMMGERLDLSPLVVILSLAFWATVWGVVGMIMAVPLMVAVKIVLENIPHARPLAALLTNVPANAGKG